MGRLYCSRCISFSMLTNKRKWLVTPCSTEHVGAHQTHKLWANGNTFKCIYCHATLAKPRALRARCKKHRLAVEAEAEVAPSVWSLSIGEADEGLNEALGPPGTPEVSPGAPEEPSRQRLQEPMCLGAPPISPTRGGIVEEAALEVPRSCGFDDPEADLLEECEFDAPPSPPRDGGHEEEAALEVPLTSGFDNPDEDLFNECDF